MTQKYENVEQVEDWVMERSTITARNIRREFEDITGAKARWILDQMAVYGSIKVLNRNGRRVLYKVMKE